MSEQSDYDRLRADVLALRDAFEQERSSWATVRIWWPLEKVNNLLEKHPATPSGKESLKIFREIARELSEENQESSEPSPPTPARATAVSELVVAARRYVEDMGPCDCIDEDDDESYCSDPRCQYCALAKAVNPRELDL